MPDVSLTHRSFWSSPISRRQRQFEALVDEHYEPLWSYVSFLTRGATEAEDITHQAFLLAFDRLLDEKAIDDMGLWLRGVARNLVRAWWREKRKLPARVADYLCRLAEEADSGSLEELRSERQAALAKCMQKLSSDELQLVQARYRDGLKLTQIAKLNAANEATTRVRLFRIRERLKTCIELALAQGAVT